MCGQGEARKKDRGTSTTIKEEEAFITMTSSRDYRFFRFWVCLFLSTRFPRSLSFCGSQSHGLCGSASGLFLLPDSPRSFAWGWSRSWSHTRTFTPRLLSLSPLSPPWTHTHCSPCHPKLKEPRRVEGIGSVVRRRHVLLLSLFSKVLAVKAAAHVLLLVLGKVGRRGRRHARGPSVVGLRGRETLLLVLLGSRHGRARGVELGQASQVVLAVLLLLLLLVLLLRRLLLLLRKGGLWSAGGVEGKNEM